jgi:cyclopropane fatty-acyl-phospholipid synthase-like methyltransferase
MRNSINLLLSLVRRDERAVVNLYQVFSSYACLLTGTNMINFGFWTHETKSIKQAQLALCTLTGKLSELDSAKKIIDIGSGFSGPAKQWNLEYKYIDNLICIDINYHALKMSRVTNSRYTYDRKLLMKPSVETNITNKKYTTNNSRATISIVNATATCLPFAHSFADRIIALESAQHFKSFLQFIQESHRVLKKGGLIVIAIPVVTRPNAIGMSCKNTIFDSLRNVRVLGILSLTWASEHYELDQIKSIISQEHFVIKDIVCIGPSVYVPLTDFYVQDRKEFRRIIMDKHSSFLKKLALDIAERIVHRSALKMKQLSLSGNIDYVLIKALNK